MPTRTTLDGQGRTLAPTGHSDPASGRTDSAHTFDPTAPTGPSSAAQTVSAAPAAVVDATPVACCWVSQGGIVHHNTLAAELFGESPPPHTPITRYGIPWGDLAAKPCNASGVVQGEAALRRANDALRQVRVSLRPMADGEALCVLTDLPHGPPAPSPQSQDLQAERDHLRVVLESVAAGVMVMDLNGVVRGAYSVRCGGKATPLLPGVSVYDIRDAFHVERPNGEPVPFEQWPYLQIMQGLPVRDVLLFVRPINETSGGWFRYNGKVVRDAANNEDLIVMTVRDETEEHVALTALRDSEERFREIFDNTTVGLTMIDASSGRFLAVNDRMGEMLGYSRDELLGMTFADVTHPDDRAADSARFKDAFENEAPKYGMEKRYRRRDGSTLRAWLEVVVRKHTGLTPKRAFGIVLDITARKEAEERLRESEERFRAIFENAAVGVTVVDGGSRRFLEVNHCLADMLGYTRQEMLHLTIDDITHPEDRHLYPDGLAEVTARGGRQFSAEKRHLCKDGSLKWVQVEVAVQRDQRGRHTRSIGVVRDITASKVAEERLRESEARFRRLADSIPEVVWVAEPDGRLRYRNRRSQELFTPAGPEELDSLAVHMIHPEDIARRNLAWSRSLRTGQTYECELRVAMPDGSGYRWMLARAVAVRDDDGQIEGWYGSATDVHDLKLIEQALQDERDRFMTTAKASPGVLNSFRIGPDGELRIPYASPGIEALTGVPAEQLARDATPLLEAIHHDDLSALRELVGQAVARKSGWSYQFRLEHPLRGEVWLEGRFAHGASVEGVITQHGVLSDVTDTRRVADHIRETQKMEAVGRLAGGVAHDFNNLLSVILGEAELLLEQGGPDAATQDALGIIIDAAGKGAALTRQLLTFSRRQPQTPRPFDLNAQVEELWKLVTRLAGDGIDCESLIAEQPLNVRADPVHIEQALFNLVVNARDAMNDSGRIVVRTRLVDEPAAPGGISIGPWAELSVSDEGPGISDEVLQRLFEPFFTTKDVDKGTGLGLAVVHGIAEQCGGSITAESPSDGGATFRLRLPLCEAGSAPGAEPRRR